MLEKLKLIQRLEDEVEEIFQKIKPKSSEIFFKKEREKRF